jgi:glutaredoxin
MIKKAFRNFLIFSLAALFVFWAVSVLAQETKPVEVVAFHQAGCPHCASQEKFFDDNLKKNYNVEVKVYDILNNSTNIQLFKAMAEAYNVEIDGVPTVFVGDQVFSGHDGNVELAVVAEVQRCLADGCEDPLSRLSDININGQPVTQDQKFKNIGYTVIGVVIVLIIIIIAFSVKPKRKQSI